MKTRETTRPVYCYPLQYEKVITFYTVLWDSDDGISAPIL